MDPGKGNNNDRGPVDRRGAQRRLRAVRPVAQRGGRFRAHRSDGTGDEDGTNNGDPRPEEAPSSMGHAARRGAAAAGGDPPANESTARHAAALPNRSRSSEDDAESDADDNPKLNELLQHLREFCRDGDRKGPYASAIDVEKARNVLEACAGNVPLAGQLYWDDYFASQMHAQQPAPQPQPNLPPLDAPSAPAAELAPPDPQEEERRVRRRLENDFERLLPAAPPEEAALPEARPSRRRRRRRRGPDAENEIGAGGVLGAVALGNHRNNNNRHNVEDDVQMEEAEPDIARPPVRQRPPQRPEDNQALFVAARAVLGAGEDAAEGSVSVSDDETGVAGVLRMVREGGRSRVLNRRRRRSSSLDGNLEYIRALEAYNAQVEAAVDGDDCSNAEKRKLRKGKQGVGGGGGGGDDDSSDSEDSNKDADDDDSAYLSDNDWMFDPPNNSDIPAPSAASAGSTSQPVQNLRSPMEVLWKGLPPPSISTSKPSQKIKKEDSDDGKDDAVAGREKKKKDEAANDEGDADNDGNDEAEGTGATKRPEIPSTWLHASFSPDSSAMGLALKDPKPEDVAEHSWRLQQISNDGAPGNPRRNNTLPLPYHCRGISAVLSIVTALMYTGASVQSNQVTCSSSRVPFLEIQEEELRKRQFDSRLIDALSSLIFIAARASMERKKKALDKKLARKKRKRKRRMKKKEGGLLEDTEEFDAFQKSLERKLKLSPVAWWKEGQQGAPNLPAEQWEASLDDSDHKGPRIQLNMSLSNMCDIRAYVLSNMQSFTSPGGVALLLETIVSIHGKGAVSRMMLKCHQAAPKSGQPDDGSKSPYLVKCTCEERQKKRLKDPSLSPAARRKLMNSLDTTPPGHECVSTELISLLLTGKIHSSFEGWGTGPLCFGILSNKPGEVGKDLARPERPVWVLKGETCYSTLLLDYTNHGDNLDEKAVILKPGGNKNEKVAEKKKSLSPSKPKATPCMKIAMCSGTSRSRDLQEAKAFASADQPGFIANMAHWNPWHGVRNLSGLRLITARPKWSPPTPSWVLANYKAAPKAKHSSSLTCQRKSVAEQLSERRSFQSNIVSADEREATGSEPVLDEAAIDRVRLHPDDAKFYPKQHRLWRFDLGSKPLGDHWVPYHSLSRQDQMIVESKYGPQINRILWSRWPGATIDRFTPEGKKEPLPVV